MGGQVQSPLAVYSAGAWHINKFSERTLVCLLESCTTCGLKQQAGVGWSSAVDLRIPVQHASLLLLVWHLTLWAVKERKVYAGRRGLWETLDRPVASWLLGQCPSRTETFFAYLAGSL